VWAPKTPGAADRNLDAGEILQPVGIADRALADAGENRLLLGVIGRGRLTISGYRQTDTSKQTSGPHDAIITEVFLPHEGCREH
jgi:hypothetical protein